MSKSVKKKKQQQQQRIQERKLVNIDPPDQNILNSINSPNIWTPGIEDAWLEELNKIPAKEIYCRFPPIKKPPSVRKRGKSHGWNGNS